VCEREPGGVLYVRKWDPRGGKHATGAHTWTSLKHRDQDRAISGSSAESVGGLWLG